MKRSKRKFSKCAIQQHDANHAESAGRGYVLMDALVLRGLRINRTLVPANYQQQVNANAQRRRKQR